MKHRDLAGGLLGLWVGEAVVFWLMLTSAVTQHHTRQAANTAADAFDAVGGRLPRLPRPLAAGDSCRPALQMAIQNLFHKWRPKVSKPEIRPR